MAERRGLPASHGLTALQLLPHPPFVAHLLAAAKLRTTLRGPGSPRDGVPNRSGLPHPLASATSFADASHGLIVGIEWSACELSTDGPATLPSHRR